MDPVLGSSSRRKYQQGRGIATSRRELVGERPEQWCRSRPVTVCEHCGQAIKGNQWAVHQHQQSKRCLTASGRTASDCTAG